ncbi:type II toxin-antitoxin system VapC family toxin [Aurantimonas sp. 22II-16-19i]|uniref:type II toxin-antitoxin system VapC family toxin n=1 Tax=Aurantimonas sp. 22II-16-19i TaxID=1317114 RepID=UPI0009F7BADF|nr:type II toxin-antitoxin system VapC family toxin [Aurantimonas sp. 22II-16-19i]ORE98211.1 PilT protein domain protein [Aurantimonas sp. 22II-16-19i]
MSVLLDTHALLWWLTADPHLSVAAKSAIEDVATERHVSAVTAFELANKVRIGKLEVAREIIETFDDIIAQGRFTKLDVDHSHALLAGQMLGVHKDPFDRLLAAQAKIEGLALITVDEAFDQFGIIRLW